MSKWIPLLLCIVATVIACDLPRSNRTEGSSSKVTREVIQFSSNEILLEGILELPTGSHALPLVIFVHGSGRATRNDYANISTGLNSWGYATFRYDKRGVGKSGGTFQEVGTSNSVERIGLLAEDAAEAIRYLGNRKEIDRKKIIVMGGSQAGWIIPVVCSLTDVALTVCLSGPCISVGEEMFYSYLAERGHHPQSEADKMLNYFNGDHGFDNAGYVGAMKKPSLWIFGGRDVSIPVVRCIARLDSLKLAAALPLDIKLYPEADHGILNTSTHQREDFENLILKWLKTNM